MKIAINTSCAVAGGTITHLRNVLPYLVDEFAKDELVVIGNATSRERIAKDVDVHWHEVEAAPEGLFDRIRFENTVLPDLVETLGADLLFHPTNFCAFRVRIPQVILIHNLAPFLEEVIAGESVAQKIRLAILRRLTVYSLKQAVRTIFISRWGRDLVIAPSNPDDVRMPIVPFGAEHGSRGTSLEILDRWGVRPDGFALTVSHLYRYKKIEKLVEAWLLLAEEHRAMPLVVVGEPFDLEYAARLEARVAEAELNVVFTGSMGAGELATMMSACRLFLFSSEAENLPITLLEAMAARCAIVTNRACSMPEVCGDAVVFADPATPECYAEEIDRVLSDAELRADLEERAFARAQDFTWPSTAKRTADVLRSALRSR